MDIQKLIKKAIKENPEIALVLEVSSRARENGERESIDDLRPNVGVGANPTAAQGVISLGCVLGNERDFVS